MAKRETRAQRRARYAREKERDPVGWAYRTLKANAKRRGKSFSLTLDEFKGFCYETQLLTKRGVKSKSYSIDRIDNRYGYHIGNIQKMELGENVRKDKTLVYDYETGKAKIIQQIEYDKEHYPF